MLPDGSIFEVTEHKSRNSKHSPTKRGDKNYVRGYNTREEGMISTQQMAKAYGQAVEEDPHERKLAAQLNYTDDALSRSPVKFNLQAMRDTDHSSWAADSGPQHGQQSESLLVSELRDSLHQLSLDERAKSSISLTESGNLAGVLMSRDDGSATGRNLDAEDDGKVDKLMRKNR